MRKSFYTNTFWVHVIWTRDGRIGVDQHGHTWYNMENPVSETGLTPDGY
jgi:hypothetical protein